MSDSVVMSFVGDLYPRRLETPDAVASGIAWWCKPDVYRSSPPEIREVVRTAGEWQGTLPPRRRLWPLRARARATEADFLAAAHRAYERRLQARRPVFAPPVAPRPQGVGREAPAQAAPAAAP